MYSQIVHQKSSTTTDKGDFTLQVSPVLQFHVLEAKNSLLKGNYAKALFHCQEALLLDEPASYYCQDGAQADLDDLRPADREFL